MERLLTDAIKQSLPLHWDNFLNIFGASIKNRHKELYLSQELNVILRLLDLSKPYWKLWPRCSPANKVKWHQKLFATTAWLSPWDNSWLLQGFPDHRHCTEHSATLLGINSCQVHSESLGRAGLPAACWFLTLCGSLSARAAAGRERSRRTAAAPSRTQLLDNILSRCTAHPALWIKPSPPMSDQGWGMQGLPMIDKRLPPEASVTPERSVERKEEKTLPLWWLWLNSFSIFIYLALLWYVTIYKV